jgi:hypothetical protein
MNVKPVDGAVKHLIASVRSAGPSGKVKGVTCAQISFRFKPIRFM